MRLPITLVLLGQLACRSRDPSAEMSARTESHAELIDQIRANGVTDARVLAAMAAVARHEFVLAELSEHAYDDRPLPIGHDVTISQPTIVATMTELADIQPGERVLEVGTGSGYQAAVLAELGAEVYSIERVEALATEAQTRLHALGYTNVHVRYGDGFLGWPERAPFDAILVTAAPPGIPIALTDQLAVGGKLVVPVGPEPGNQALIVVERTRHGLRERRAGDVVFVPMLPGLE